jgi:splicing factor 3B subunit 2
LKAYKNTIPVPKHWSQKKRYLQGKRGIEKVAYNLPEYIQATGITQLRDKQRNKPLKLQARERMNPKLGKMDIAYQVLHDAFFKYQTVPQVTQYGDLYYEGKEFEVKIKDIKPGVISQKLRKALGMPPDAPPPWLITMQRYGPPPAYPNLKIPGLNTPIPDGAKWGFHPGGWGRAPVDENGKPLYGDVFGKKIVEEKNQVIEYGLFGEFEDEILDSVLQEDKKKIIPLDNLEQFKDDDIKIDEESKEEDKKKSKKYFKN